MILEIYEFSKISKTAYKGSETNKFPTFSDPEYFFSDFRVVELGFLKNFEPFWYSRTFLKNS